MPTLRPTRRALALLAACLSLAPKARGAGALGQDRPGAAYATFKGENLALVIGYQSGAGQLTFKGRRHDFRVRGLSAVGLGAERLEGTAEVRHLGSLADFEGVYWGLGAGGSLILGHGAAILRNGKGVEIALRLQSRGLALVVAAGGARIVLG